MSRVNSVNIIIVARALRATWTDFRFWEVLSFDWLTHHYQSSPPTAIFLPVLAPNTKRPYNKDVKQTLQECLFKSWLKEVWKHIGENWNENWKLRTKPNNTLGCSVTSGLLDHIAQISLSASDRQSWITIIYLAACLQQWAYWLLTPIAVYQV